MTRIPIRYQAAIIEKDHILLLRVIDLPTQETFWLFPGGAPEANETPEETIRREVLEETTLHVDAQRFLFALPDISEGFYDQLHTYLCVVNSGSATPGVEPEVDTAEHTTIQEVGWFDLRAPASWPALLRNDPITYPLLMHVCSVLGYPMG